MYLNVKKTWTMKNKNMGKSNSLNNFLGALSFKLNKHQWHFAINCAQSQQLLGPKKPQVQIYSKWTVWNYERKFSWLLQKRSESKTEPSSWVISFCFFFYLLFCSMRFGFAFDWYHLLKIEEMRKNKRLKTSKCSQNVHWVNLLKTNFRSVNSSEIQTQEPKALDWFFKNSSPTLKFLVNQAWLGWVQNLPNSIHPKVWTPT